MEGRDEVVVLLARLVVLQGLALQGRLGQRQGDGAVRGGPPGHERGRRLEVVEGRSRIAVGGADHVVERLGLRLDREPAQAAPGVAERPTEDLRKLLLGEGPQDHDAGAGQKRRDDFEGRVFRRGADQRDEAALHVGQEGVLLGLVEPVDLVDKQDRSPARPLQLDPGFFDDAPDLLDSGENRRKGGEMGLRLAGDDAGKGGLPGAGRPPEDHGKEAVLLDGLAQQPSLFQDVGLTHIFLEGFRPHPVRQGAGIFQSLIGGVHSLHETLKRTEGKRV